MNRTGLVVSTVALLAFVAGAALMLRSVATEVKRPVDLPRVAYATSKDCVMCHPGHYESWHRTFHRTMTQPATSGAVVGDFENRTLTYAGVTSRFTHEGDRYFIETLAPDGTLQRYPIVMTIGSRRMQQYATKVADRYVRLPLAWNIEEKRWVHLNGAFLHPDGSDFNTHRADWDYNCIFCHNVKAQPRFNDATDTFDARVAEMGIACEACHGPAEEHIARNADPVRRYFLYLSGRDPTIQSPKEMTPNRQIQVCGHCHGQRTPNPPQRIAEFMMVGDPYTAGEDLSQFTKPIEAHTTLPGLDFGLRFWKDGTPRLTAYEYQGLLMSKGHEDTKLTCISCHTMHGGDPRGMITTEMRGNAGCLQCHGEIAKDVAAHTKHDPSGTGSNCYGCHMPPTTYGLLAIHPSHRISNPDPSRAWRFQMPEACTVCHTDKTAAWAARETSRQYGTPLPADIPESNGYEYAETVRALFAGDVVQRAVAVNALTQEKSATRDARARLWAVPLLLVTMEDRYPAIRHFAHRGLVALVRRAGVAPRSASGNAPALPEFDYLAEPPLRAASIERWWSWWRAFDKQRVAHPGDVPLDAGLMPRHAEIARLVARQDPHVIAIGE